MRNKFIDPVTAAEYPWAINHDTEEAYGKSRSITFSANSANTGLVRQQGDIQPLTLRYSGTILTLSQYLAMWDWFNLCDLRTIYFEDFEGNRYEVTITSFLPIRKRVAKNPKDPGYAPTHIWTYTIEMDVVRTISGPIAGRV